MNEVVPLSRWWVPCYVPCILWLVPYNLPVSSDEYFATYPPTLYPLTGTLLPSCILWLVPCYVRCILWCLATYPVSSDEHLATYPVSSEWYLTTFLYPLMSTLLPTLYPQTSSCTLRLEQSEVYTSKSNSQYLAKETFDVIDIVYEQWMLHNNIFR